MNNRYLVVGPLSPAIGGIATIVGALKQAFEGDSNVVFLDTTKTTEGLRRYLRPFNSMINVVAAASGARKGAVLMFSSAQASFWEKCFWCAIFRLFGWRTVVQMVAGDFPSYYEEMSRPAKWLSSILMRNVDILAAQSPYWKAVYGNIFPRTTVEIVSPGIDTDFFVPSCDRKPRGDIEILYMGWLIEAKGIYDLLEAARTLKHNGLNFKLKLIGPAFGAEQTFIDYVKKHDLDGVIDIPGPLTSRVMVRAAFQSADIFAFPSHFEGFPYALMEAVSSGLPCVGTRVGGIPDILDNGFCGVLVEKKSPGQMAEALSKLIVDAECRKNFGDRARQRAIREYSLRKSVDDFKYVLHMAREI